MPISPPNPYPFHRAHRLATAAEMRAMDAHAIDQLGLPGRVLMENAAQHVAQRVLERLAERFGQSSVDEPDGFSGSIVVVCGRGNNGGDGYAVARLLADRGLPVTAISAGQPAGADALANAEAWERFGITLDWEADGPKAVAALNTAAALVDALFGTGLTRTVEASAAALIDALNAAAAAGGAPVIAVDVPSGVDSDTGQVLGCAVQCTDTVSFQAAKPGCFQHPGAALAGRVEVAPISIPRPWPRESAPTYLRDESLVATLLPQRPAAGHKGTFGHVLTLCGSSGMGGAALLASRGALAVGAGLVTAGVPAILLDRFVPHAPELMTLSAPGGGDAAFEATHAPFMLAQAQERTACVLGCGLGRQEETGAFVREIVAGLERPLLVDADGLYHLKSEHLRARPAPTVLTPHPGELARLSGTPRKELSADRVAHTRRLAAEFNAVLVLKGAASVIAAPDGSAFINPTGDSGLAGAGSGDVLSGIIGGLLAQGLAALPAALAGVYLHGMARDLMAAEISAAAFTASDLFAGLNRALLHFEQRGSV